MSNLTDDEFTVLMIAAEGQSMIPIGRWEKSVLSLTAKGYLRKADDVNFYITEAGRQAVKDRDKQDDAVFAQIINRTSKMVSVQSVLTKEAEQMAKLLLGMASQSQPMTGDPLDVAIRQWGRVITDRALELAK